MKQQEIKKAANEYALGILGAEQFKANKYGRASVSNDFKAGVKWAQEQAKMPAL